VSTATIEEQLAEVRHRIDALHTADGACRFRRHVDVVTDVEQRLGQLKTRLDVAERSLAADVSGDWAAFVAAVESELESWDTHLEQLQTTVARRAWHTREQAETAIADVRSLRIAVGERLAHTGDAIANGRQEQRERVGAARDELEQRADELSAKLTWKRTVEEESEMQTNDPALLTALVAMSAAMLMVHAGIAKRHLAWRIWRTKSRRRRRP